MNLSEDKQEIFCHICNEWVDKFTDIYLEDNQVKCLCCDALLGYTHDLPDEKENE